MLAATQRGRVRVYVHRWALRAHQRRALRVATALAVRQTCYRHVRASFTVWHRRWLAVRVAQQRQTFFNWFADNRLAHHHRQQLDSAFRAWHTLYGTRVGRRRWLRRWLSAITHSSMAAAWRTWRAHLVAERSQASLQAHWVRNLIIHLVYHYTFCLSLR